MLTQLCDVQWEANGLFDMNRTPKTYTGEFGLANGEHAVALRPDVDSVLTGDDLAATVTSLPSRSMTKRSGSPARAETTRCTSPNIRSARAAPISATRTTRAARCTAACMPSCT